MSDQPGSLAEALTALQAKLPRITKDSEAQAGNRKITYANLATITETVPAHSLQGEPCPCEHEHEGDS